MLIPKEVFKVSECCDTEAGRYALGAILVERQGEECRAVTTDGQRLLVARWTDERRGELPDAVKDETDCDKLNEEGCRVLIPRKNWEDVGKLIPNGKSLSILQNALMAESHDVNQPPVRISTLDEDHTVTRKTIRQLQGRFPRWEDIIPTYHDVSRTKTTPENMDDAVHFTIDGDLLMGIIKSMILSDVGGAKVRQIKITVPVATGRAVRLDACGESIGSGKVAMTGVLMPLKE